MKRMIFGAIAAVLLLGFVASVGRASAEISIVELATKDCEPCRAMVPVVEQLRSEGVIVGRYAAEKQDSATLAYYGVSKFPTFLAVENGRTVIDRVVGVVPAERLRAMVRRPAIRIEAGPSPTAAWRYEWPTGHRASVVRIECEDNPGKSWGSGTYIMWQRRPLIVTARHVIAGAAKIWIWTHTKHRYSATVLRADSTWDCAVLSLDKQIVDIKPAEIAFGDEATLQANMRLSSYGYGPDNKLVVNEGLFRSYRRSVRARDNNADWMVISGYARQGDSGGGVFTQSGKLIGVLWGCNAEGSGEVVCVQPGRLHAVLKEAVPDASGPVITRQNQENLRFFDAKTGQWVDGYQQRQWRPSPSILPTQCSPGSGCSPAPSSIFPGRQASPLRPSPPLPGPPVSAGPLVPIPDTSATVSEGERQHMLPYRADQDRKDADTAGELRRINETLARIQILMQQQPQQTAPPAPSAPQEKPKSEAEEKDGGPKTALGRLADKEAGWLAEHGGPISSRIAAQAEENLDSDSAAIRFKGFTQAKVALLIFCTTILLILGLAVFVLHRLNNKLIPKLQEAAAKTPNTLDDKLVGLLSGIHERVNSVEDRVKSHLPDMAAIRAKAEAALHIGTAAALATPGGPAASAAAAGTVAAVEALKNATYGVEKSA